MAVHDIATESDLAKVLERAETVIIDFWSPVGPPCKAFASVFEEASSRHGEVAFYKVNTQEDEDLSSSFEEEHIPTLVVIRDRAMVALQPGYLMDGQLDDLLGQAVALDMDPLVDDEAELQDPQEDGP